MKTTLVLVTFAVLAAHLAVIATAQRPPASCAEASFSSVYRLQNTSLITTCPQLATCVDTYCSCLGSTRRSNTLMCEFESGNYSITNGTTVLYADAMSVPDTAGDLSNATLSAAETGVDAVGTCSTFTQCVADRFKCLQAASSTECLPTLRGELNFLEMGVMYTYESKLDEACVDEICVLRSELTDDQESDCPTDTVTQTVCRNIVSTKVELRLGGAGWAQVLSTVDNSTLRGALESDSTKIFNVTFVNSIALGSLVVELEIQQAFSTDLEAAINTAAAAATWLTSTNASYFGATGLTDLVILSLRRIDTEIAATFTKGSSCGTGCIVAATIGSVVGFILIVLMIISLYCMGRKREVLSMRRRWLKQGGGSESECRIRLWFPNSAGDAITSDIKADTTLSVLGEVLNRSVDKYSFLANLAQEALSHMQSIGVEPEEITKTFAFRIRNRLLQIRVNDLTQCRKEIDEREDYLSDKRAQRKKRSKAPFGNDDSDEEEDEQLVELKSVLESLERGNTWRPWKRHDRMLFRDALYGLMHSELVTFTDKNAIMPEHVAMYRTMFQPDSDERIERACFFDFTTEEARMFRSVIEHKQDRQMNRDLFKTAYDLTKGHQPSRRTVDRLFWGKHESEVVDEKVIFDNMTTAPSAAERCFAFDFTSSHRVAQKMRRDFFLYVVFIAFFVAQLTLTNNFNSGFYTQAAISDTLDGDFTEIGLQDDAWDWIEGTLIPTLWSDDGTKAPIQTQSFPIGALMLRQVRVDSEEATDVFDAFFETRDPRYENTSRELFSDKTPGALGRRHRQYSSSRVEAEDYGFSRDLSVTEDIRNAFRYKKGDDIGVDDTVRGVLKQIDYPADGYAAVLPFRLSTADATNKLNELRSRSWIDRQTAMVVAHFFVFNRDTSLVSRYRYVLELTPGGSVFPTRSIDVFHVFTADSQYFGEAFFAFLVLTPFLLVFFIIPLDAYDFVIGVPRRIMMERQETSIARHIRYIVTASLFDFWAVVRFLNALLFVASWVLQFIWVATDYDTLEDPFHRVERFPRGLDAIAQRQRIYYYLTACNAMLTFFILIAYCRLVPSLAAVTRTFNRAFGSLVGIALIFIIMICAFTLCSYIVYGNNMDNYSEFGRALSTNCLMLIEIYDYEAWKTARRTYTPVYYTLFMVFMVLLLLNMIISVLMDAFQDESNEAFKGDAVTSLIINDAHSTILPPSWKDHLRGSSVIGFLRTTVVLMHLNFKRFVQWIEIKMKRVDDERYVDPEFDYRDSRKELLLSNAIHFWDSLHDAVDRVCNGTFVDSFIGLAYIDYLNMPVRPGDNVHVVIPEGALDATPDRKTSLENTKPESLSLYKNMVRKFGRSAEATLVLLQQLPSYHLQVPTPLLVIDILRHHHDWDKRISQYAIEDEDDKEPEMVARDLIPRYTQIRNSLSEESARMWDDDEDGDINEASMRGIEVARNRDIAIASATEGMEAKGKPIAVNNFFVCPVSPLQGESLLDFCQQAAIYVEDSFMVPIDVFVHFWNNLGIGKEVDKRDSYGWEIEVADFADLIIEDTQRNRFIGVDSVETLVRLGRDEYARRERQELALMWTTQHALDFQIAIEDCKDMTIEDDNGVEERAFPEFDIHTEPIPEELFEHAWYCATKGAIPKNIKAFNGQIMYDSFRSYCTKNPFRSQNMTFPMFLSRNLKQKSKDIFSALWYMLFLALFTYFVLSARGLGRGINVNDALEAQLGSSWGEVGDDDGLYSWLTDELIDKVYVRGDTRGMTTLADNVNVPIGAIKIRNVRSKTDAGCKDDFEDFVGFSEKSLNSTLNSFYDDRVKTYFSGPCAKKWSNQFSPDLSSYGGIALNETLTRGIEAFQYRSCTDLRGDGEFSSAWEYYGCDGHTLTIPLNYTAADAKALVAFLKKYNWVDAQTAAVIVDLHVFNFNIRALSRVRFTLETQVGGGVVPTNDKILTVPWLLSRHSNWYLFFFAVYFLFVVLSFWFVFQDLATIFVQFRNSGVTIGGSLNKMFTRDYWWILRVAKSGLLFYAWVLRVKIMVTGNNRFAMYNFDSVVDNVESLAEEQKVLDYIEATTIVLCYFLILYYFRMVPHLNVLVRTLQLALRHILSLILVFYIVFLCFALTGFLVYGNVLREFSSFNLSSSTLFLVLMGIEADYVNMASYHPIFSGIFYTVFLIACFMILFNLIISVLGVAFMQASDEMYDLTRFRSIFREDTLVAVEYSDDTPPLQIIFQLVVSELYLLFNATIYFVTWPFADRPTRIRRRQMFLHNPRFFWGAVVESLESANPRRHYMKMIRALNVRDSKVYLVSEEGRDRDADDEDDEVQMPLHDFLGYSQVAQAQSDRKLRVSRLHEFMADSLMLRAESHCDSSLALAKVATSITNIEGKMFLEDLLQAHHLYKMFAQQHTVDSMDLDEAMTHLLDMVDSCNDIAMRMLYQREAQNEADAQDMMEQDELDRTQRESVRKQMTEKQEKDRVARENASRATAGERVAVVTLEGGIFDAKVVEVVKHTGKKNVKRGQVKEIGVRPILRNGTVSDEVIHVGVDQVIRRRQRFFDNRHESREPVDLSDRELAEIGLKRVVRDGEVYLFEL